MSTKYFVYAQSGVRISNIKRIGGAFKEQIPNKLGEFVTAPEDFHELGSTFEVTLENQTPAMLHDLLMLEWSRVIVRLDSKYKNSVPEQIAGNEIRVLLSSNEALKELSEFYNKFITKEQKQAYKDATTPTKIK